MTEHWNTREQKEHCPYCGQLIHLIVEPATEIQNYIEDCEVCCRPISISIDFDGHVSVQREDDV